MARKAAQPPTAYYQSKMTPPGGCPSTLKFCNHVNPQTRQRSKRLKVGSKARLDGNNMFQIVLILRGEHLGRSGPAQVCGESFVFWTQ